MEVSKDKARGRWELPEALRVTPERLAAFDEAQRELARRVNSPFANLTPSEHARARAAQLIPELAMALDHVEKQLGRVFTRKGVEHFGELTDAQKNLWRQLAEAHAATGRFDEAARYEYDRTEKARYLRWWRAVWRDDEHFCACPRTNAGLPQFFAVADIFSVKHGREMALVKCGGCRCLNVTSRADILGPIREQRSHRRAALAIGAKTPADEKRMLSAAKLTTAHLLRDK